MLTPMSIVAREISTCSTSFPVCTPRGSKCPSHVVYPECTRELRKHTRHWVLHLWGKTVKTKKQILALSDPTQQKNHSVAEGGWENPVVHWTGSQSSESHPIAANCTLQGGSSRAFNLLAMDLELCLWRWQDSVFTTKGRLWSKVFGAKTMEPSAAWAPYCLNFSVGLSKTSSLLHNCLLCPNPTQTVWQGVPMLFDVSL
jgi:hypothetical protein